MRTINDLIAAAHAVIDALLLTEVEERDVEAALDLHCLGWSEDERRAVLRIATEFADVKATALTYAIAVGQPLEHAMSEIDHYTLIAHELGGVLDMPVFVAMTNRDMEDSIRRRFAHPLTP